MRFWGCVPTAAELESPKLPPRMDRDVILRSPPPPPRLSKEEKVARGVLTSNNNNNGLKETNSGSDDDLEKQEEKSSSIADLRMKAKRHQESLGINDSD